MNKLTTLLGLSLATAFLLGLATTLTRSSMIGFFDILPVYILMVIAIGMMYYEAFGTTNFVSFLEMANCFCYFISLFF